MLEQQQKQLEAQRELQRQEQLKKQQVDEAQRQVAYLQQQADPPSATEVPQPSNQATDTPDLVASMRRQISALQVRIANHPPLIPPPWALFTAMQCAGALHAAQA